LKQGTGNVIRAQNVQRIFEFAIGKLCAVVDN